MTGAARAVASATGGSPTPPRALYAAADHVLLSRMWVAGLRERATLRGPGSRAAHYVGLLLAESEELREIWGRHEVGIYPEEVKRFVHPQVGALELACQALLDRGQSHYLLVYTAIPGSESYEKMQLLSVVGARPWYPDIAT